MENTRDDVLVVIGDRLYAIKLEALDEYSKLRAIRVASKIGDQKQKEIEEVISKISEKNLVKIARFRSVLDTKYYEYRLWLLMEYYRKNKIFYDYVVKIVKSTYGRSPHRLTNERIDKLAEYVLRELPLYLNGARYGGKYYECTVYPGLGLIDELIFGLHEKKIFLELAEKLKLHNKISILEAYVD